MKVLLFTFFLLIGCNEFVSDKNETRKSGIIKERNNLNWTINTVEKDGELTIPIVFRENVDQLISSGYSVTCDSVMMCKISWREP